MTTPRKVPKPTTPPPPATPPKPMTTPPRTPTTAAGRALEAAAVLTMAPDGSRFLEVDADATLSALAAEGWVLVADPWPMDVERLRDWWDSLSELDQFNAYRIEKSNADALAAPDPAPLAEAVAAERARIYGQLVDRLWGCDADANAVLDIVEDDAAIEGSKE